MAKLGHGGRVLLITALLGNRQIHIRGVIVLSAL